ncbi:hypothetical protein JYU34_005074 [Plutella xylostella]|uniref:Uncharacterized protein n=1 Tax=Plutella xylostella TaxID=51655 RepID=A0ABQ7QVS4_PLUXY|nr:hypothetical protein JYU34_005074 [Plutella xylostella]
MCLGGCCALSILPTILYLATGVLQWSDGDGDVASAAILLLQAAAETRCVRVHEETARQHSQLLHSTTDKLLTLVKNDEPGQSISALLGARAMAALIPHAAPAPALHYPCINHFRQCLDEPSHETFAACCAVVRNIWSSSASPECVSWWARALAPRLIARAAAAKYPVDASHTKAAVAALTALTDLVDVAPDDTAREFSNHFNIENKEM